MGTEVGTLLGSVLGGGSSYMVLHGKGWLLYSSLAPSWSSVLFVHEMDKRDNVLQDDHKILHELQAKVVKDRH